MFLPRGGNSAAVARKFDHEPLRASERAAETSLPPSFRLSVDGSMTLEAAVAVPLFLFFVMNLLFIFEAVRLQSGLQAALQQAGEQICEAAYYTRFGWGEGQEEDGAGSNAGTGENSEAFSFIASETFVRNKVTSYLGDSFWDHSCVVGGRAGLSCVLLLFLILRRRRDTAGMPGWGGRQGAVQRRPEVTAAARTRSMSRNTGKCITRIPAVSISIRRSGRFRHRRSGIIAAETERCTIPVSVASREETGSCISQRRESGITPTAIAAAL